MYDKSVTKINAIDTSGFVLKVQYNTDKSVLENKIDSANKKIPDTSGLIKKTDYNPKITEIQGKISSISDFSTTFPLNAVENKIPNVSNLVNKANYNIINKL